MRGFDFPPVLRNMTLQQGFDPVYCYGRRVVSLPQPVKIELTIECDTDTASDIMRQYARTPGRCPKLAQVLGALVMNLGKEE